ncbi:MAG: hypothetical protein JWO84_607 [Parcubacteria group bacterium]|nr:hypothetical protein [Parcubacteria group bacterium]
MYGLMGRKPPNYRSSERATMQEAKANQRSVNDNKGDVLLEFSASKPLTTEYG